MFLGTTAIYRVTIDGRGGDSVHDEYFVDRDDAIFASALDDNNRTPEPVIVFKFSDDTLILPGKEIHLCQGPTTEERRKVLKNLTPAQRILFERRI